MCIYLQEDLTSWVCYWFGMAIGSGGINTQTQRLWRWNKKGCLSDAPSVVWRPGASLSVNQKLRQGLDPEGLRFGREIPPKVSGFPRNQSSQPRKSMWESRSSVTGGENQEGISSLQEPRARCSSDPEPRQGQAGMEWKLKQMRHESKGAGGLGQRPRSPTVAFMTPFHGSVD